MEKVSIGIPTYNRPSGLKRTLERILNQTYPYLEIIVSDNCSPGNETENLVKELMNRDSRIKYIKQEVNRGLIYNFQFVLSQATANYFMWATDDDYFESPDLIEKLIKYAPSNILTFTNYNFVSDKNVSHNFFTSIFNNCKTKFDYVYSFCSSGAGHPSTGLYNLNMLKDAKIELRIQEDLSYHMEGMLLHRIFDTGKVKYVDDAIINYSTFSRESSTIIPIKRLNHFLIYTKRVLLFYNFQAHHTFAARLKLLRASIVLHYNYYINELNGTKYKPHKFSVALFLTKVLTSSVSKA